MASSPQHPSLCQRRRWWLGGLLVLLVVAAIAGATGFLFRERLLDEWRLWQFRQAAAAGDPDLPQYQGQLLGRLLADEVKLDLAVRLAQDTDPKVRAAAVDVLLANQPRAKKQNALQGLNVATKTASWRVSVEEAVKRLLEDEDETVRRRALQAVSELEWAGLFEGLLQKALKNGSKEERVLVAEKLAHWSAWLLWQTVADDKQPDEVRLAALHSLDRYGDKEIASARAELQTALQTALRSENKELRHAALGTLQYAARPAPVWLDILSDERRQEDHPLVLRTWIDALGSESVRDRHWFDTHEAWRHAEQARRCAIATYVMCEAAKVQMQHLDKSLPISEQAALRDRQGPIGRAFDIQLIRLENILSVVSAVHWYCGTDFNGDKDFAAWLPHETPQGALPRRKLKPYLFQQVKPIWEWCLDRRAAYPTRFLTGDKFHYYTKKPGSMSVRPLGAVMDELFLIGQTEYQMLRNRYEEK
ncbi:MAG TPA: hypothetical protein VH575_01335 [Gemmataceae bacterium]|jgi:hypothetical protein